MTYSPSINASSDETERARGLIMPVALVTIALAVAFNALGIWGDGSTGGEPMTLGGFLFGCGLIAASAGIVFGLVVPWALRRESVGGAALTLSILSLLFVAAYWSGLTPALAVGGALLGWSGRGAAKGHGMSQVGFAIGLLAVVGYVAMYVLDWMHTNNIG